MAGSNVEVDRIKINDALSPIWAEYGLGGVEHDEALNELAHEVANQIEARIAVSGNSLSAKALFIAFGTFVSNRDELIAAGYNLSDILTVWDYPQWTEKVVHWEPFENDGIDTVADHILKLAKEIEEEFNA